MNEGFHLINSGDILLIMNQNLITWLGQGYFATLFAVGMAIWCIRYLLQLTLAPLDKQNQGNKPLMYIICGIILWALLVVPLNRFPYLNTLIDAVPGQYVTPASAFGKRTLADGTDYLTLVLFLRSFGVDEPYDPHSWELETNLMLHKTLYWYTSFIGLDQVGLESGQYLEQDAGTEIEDTDGDEGGVLNGMGNFLSGGASAVFEHLRKVALILWAYLTDPLMLITLAICILMIFVVGLWFTFLGYALPFTFCAIVFCLPISYLFDGLARLVPLLKMLVALALAKPLAMMFVTLALSVIDDYFLELFHKGGVAHNFTSVFTPDFWEILKETNLVFSKPFVLGVTLTGSLMAMFAPVLAYLLLGADGGTMAGMLSASYLMVAQGSARLAGMAVTKVAGFSAGKSPLGPSSSGTNSPAPPGAAGAKPTQKGAS